MMTFRERHNFRSFVSVAGCVLRLVRTCRKQEVQPLTISSRERFFGTVVRPLNSETFQYLRSLVRILKCGMEYFSIAICIGLLWTAKFFGSTDDDIDDDEDVLTTIPVLFCLNNRLNLPCILKTYFSTALSASSCRPSASASIRQTVLSAIPLS